MANISAKCSFWVNPNNCICTFFNCITRLSKLLDDISKRLCVTLLNVRQPKLKSQLNKGRNSWDFRRSCKIASLLYYLLYYFATLFYNYRQKILRKGLSCLKSKRYVEFFKEKNRNRNKYGKIFCKNPTITFLLL